MQSIRIESASSKQAALAQLRTAIEGVADARREVGTALSTGWFDGRASDAALTEVGLGYGALHEWFGLHRGCGANGEQPPRHRRSLGVWTPALSVLVHLAARAQCTPAVVWIGRRIWPYGHALRHAHRALFDSSIFVDAPRDEERFWAIDVALRCGDAGGERGGAGCVVVADASTLPLALSRRLQLAAEAGGSLGLLARPPWEEDELSVAATRWRVRTAPSPPMSGANPRWSIELVRCKGRLAHAHSAPAWTLERADDGRLVPVSPGVAGRPRAAALAG